MACSVGQQADEIAVYVPTAVGWLSEDGSLRREVQILLTGFGGDKQKHPERIEESEVREISKVGYIFADLQRVFYKVAVSIKWKDFTF